MITERQGAVALGIPVTQGSMKCIAKPGRPHQLIDNKAKRLYVWRKQVQAAARQYFTETAGPNQGLTLVAHIYIPRPKNHFRTGRYSHLLKDDAPVYPTARQYGDTDKYLRAIGDALTAIDIVGDDAQFVRVTGEKHFVTLPGVLAQVGLPEPGAQIIVTPR